MSRAHPALRPGARGEPVVQSVYDATLEELVRVGFRALRIEDVAVRAGVHKTTVYRRWPTKGELVREAMVNFVGEKPAPPDTGSLRGDLIEIARRMVQFSTSMVGQGLMRMMMNESADPELGSICESMRATKEGISRDWLRKAVDRGELMEEIDAELLFGTLMGALQHRLFGRNQRVDDLYLAKLVDLLLMGASPRGENLRKTGVQYRNRS